MAGKLMLAAALVLAAAWPAAAQDTLQPRVQDGKFVMRDGEGIYKNVCQACHMADAKGVQGSGKYPALAADPRLAAAAYPIQVVIHGQKGMPPFGAYFDDDQIAAVIGYVRTHFDNHYAGAVKAEDVHALR